MEENLNNNLEEIEESVPNTCESDTISEEQTEESCEFDTTYEEQETTAQVEKPITQNDEPIVKKNKSNKKEPFFIFFSIALIVLAVACTACGYAISQLFYLAKEINSTPQENVQITDSISVQVNSNVAEIVEKTMPAMVSVNTKITYTQSYFFGEQTYEGDGAGTGIIIQNTDSEIVVVTNSHVIEGSKSIEINFCDNSTVPAVLKSYDKENDIALISVKREDIKEETLEKIKVAQLGNSNSLKLGEPVIAIGNSLGYGQTVTVGVVSAVNRIVKDNNGSSRKMIQTDAAINPGNSGGALLNMAGQVIGINESKIVDETVDGVGFAIPISYAKDIIWELEKVKTRYAVEESERGRIGIQVIRISEDAMQYYGMPQGIYISRIESNSPAEKAGLIVGDVIYQINSQKVESPDDMINELKYYRAGEKINIKYKRMSDGVYVEKDTNIVLAEIDD